MKKITKRIITKKRYELELYVGRALIKHQVVEEYEEIRQKDATLVGTEKLVSRKLISSKKEIVSTYPMRSIKHEEISDLRKSKKAGLLVKAAGEYFYAEIMPDLKFASEVIMGEHKCSDCKRMSPHTDEKGGCAKVRNYRCNHIEKYDFITEGYETFNTDQNCLVVVECNNVEENDSFKVASKSQKEEAKLCLAQFLWPDARSLEDVRQMHKRTFED